MILVKKGDLSKVPLDFWADLWWWVEGKKSWNPERVPSVVTLCVRVSVRVSVCEQATSHTFWHRNLIFGLSDPWEMRKKRIFLFFETFIFTLFLTFFPYITLVIIFFQATSHSFSPRNVIFGLREPCTIRNWRLLYFFLKILFLRFLAIF